MLQKIKDGTVTLHLQDKRVRRDLLMRACNVKVCVDELVKKLIFNS